ncbi:hypothetical protein CC80DRAFT_552223 [Byssothecium circinans]|uniref:Uncharacterized protein n=1 Tax=Byssothecium circinans TaxID=147558 RepID=A0A6A5TKK1_9PLEO|nr:hypothetical protein CC80DRAFT_552223 [Byssothecium circinans]
MPALYQPEMLRRAVADPNALVAELAHLVVRAKKGGKSGKGGKSKIKGGTIAGIIIAIIVIVIILAIIFFLVKRNQKKKRAIGH